MVLSALAIGWVDVSGATEFDSWEFQCMPIDGAVSEEEIVEELCTTEISTSYEGREFVIYFTHNRNGVSSLVVSGPEELFVDTIVEVHGKKPVSADNCEIGLCYFELKKSALLVQQFIRGESTRITITTDRAKTFLDKDITLAGFVTAFWRFQSELPPPIWMGRQRRSPQVSSTVTDRDRTGRRAARREAAQRDW
jgi:hypothetical protein